MDKMDLINAEVYHTTIKKEGKIVDIDDDSVYIKFQNERKIRNFPYPETLMDDDFIKLKDKDRFYDLLNQTMIKKQLKVIDDVAAKTQEQQKYNTRSSDTEVKRFSTPGDFYDFYQQQIDSEIIELKYNITKKIKIYDGHFIQKQGNAYYYIFESDVELGCPDDTPIKIYTDKQIEGKVEHCEEFTITISANENLGYGKDETIESLEFSMETWKLLGALNDRLDELKNGTPTITKRLITQGMNNITDEPMYKGQDKAIDMSLSQPITFIWGPPGTGKTQTLARIALNFIKSGYRVLMLSYSNISVDGAIKRTYELDEDKKQGKLIRYGYPKDTYLKEHEYLTSFKCACLNNKDVLAEIKTIIKEAKNFEKKSPEMLEAQKKIRQLRKKVRDDEVDLIKTAQFIATTISKAVIDKEIYSQKFDVVIFDEASMSFIPHVVFSSSLASKHFICMGDFKQLPPIVQSARAEYLNLDIFQYCGIESAVRREKCHKWLCMLDTQYRMNKEISDFVNRTMYNNNIETSETIIKDRDNISAQIGIIPTSFGLADVSNMMTVCCKNADGSHFNILSAFISFGIAMNALKNKKDLELKDIGIITPYSAQSRLLHCMSIDQKNKSHKETSMSCATVHQFQGSEKEIIIYDAVDCYREKYPGKLITTTKNKYADRLFNVAMTRSKSKFIAVANQDFMYKKGVNSRLIFGNLLKASENIRTINYKKLEHIDVTDDSCIKFYDKSTSISRFMKDLNNARVSINIDIPDSMDENENLLKILAYALADAKMKGVNITIRAENKTELPKELKQFALQRKFLYNPLVVIDKNITWFGMPFSKTNFNIDGDTIKTLARPIIRFEGKKTSSSIYSLMEMDKTADEATMIEEDEETHSIYEYILQHKKCSECGATVQLKKSFKGKFYYQCANNHKNYVDKEDVNDYIYEMKRKCPHCGRTTMEAKLGKYGVFVSCYCGRSYKIDEI